MTESVHHDGVAPDLPATITAENEVNRNAPGGVAVSELKRSKKKRKKRVNESSVVYMSRIPPGMDMGALRARLSRMGTLGRVWLRPEEKSVVAARRELGGRRRAGFMDGWVEYHRRKDAKNAISLLNGQSMSGAKRGGRWAHDLWCLKLLPRDYTWQTLIEETGGGARERVLRVKAAVAAGRRERVLVEEREALARRIERRDKEEGRDVDDYENEETIEKEKKLNRVSSMRVVRRFKQREAVPDAAYEDDIDERRAREAARRLELDNNEGTNLKRPEIDEDLVQLLLRPKSSETNMHT